MTFQAFIVSALVAAVASAQVSHVSHIGHGIHHGHAAHLGHGLVHASPLVHAVHHAPLVHAVHAPVVHAAPAYHAPVVHAAPAYAAPVVHVKEAPEPYTYTYGVADDYSKSNFNAAETSDAAGNVGGSYSVSLPDGRIQTVTYTADHTNGYVPVVEFAGAAAFPPAPAGGYVGEPGAAPYSGPYALPYEATLPGYAVAAAAAPAYAPAA